MKSKLSYKSKRTIVITAIILSLLAVVSIGTYFFVQGNKDSAAFTDGNMQAVENQDNSETNNNGETEQNEEGTRSSENSTNEQNNVEEDETITSSNEEEEENTSSGTDDTTTQSGSTLDNGTTGATTGDVPNEDYVTERIETEEVLVREDYEVAWEPLKIEATTTTAELGIVRPIIVAEKLTENKEVVAGEEIEYVITVSNLGNLEGTAIVQDKAPEKTTFKADSIKINNVEAKHEDGSAFTEAELETGIELSIKPEEVVTVSFVVIVNEKETITESDETVEIPTAGTIINTAIVNEEETNPVKTPILHTEKKSEVYRNDEKVDVAKIGDTIKYIITVTNTSEEELDVTTNIIDKAPEGTILVNDSISEGGVLANDGTISWDEITLAKGEEKEVSFSVVVNEERTGIIRNTAVVADILTNEVENPVIDVEIDKSVYNLNNGDEIGKNTSVTVNKDDVVGYKIIVTNTGDVTLSNVKVTDTRKVYLDYESAKEGKTEGSNIIAEKVTLAQGETKEYIVYYKVTANDMKDSTVKLKNVAKVEGNYEEDEKIVETIEDEDDAEVNIAKVPGIASLKERVGEGKVEPGNTITYKITVTNTGNTNLTNVKVFDTMNNNPKGSSREVTIIGLTVAGSSKSIPTKVDGAYNIGNLAIGQMAVITATYTVTENDMAETEKTITNTVKAEGLSDGDVKVESDESKVDVKTKVWKADINLKKTSQLTKVNPNSLVGTTTAEYGDTIKYTITATNKGRKAGTVVVKDYIPAGAELVAYSATNGTTNLTQAEYNELKSATTSNKFSKELTVAPNNGTTSIYFTVKVTAKPGATVKNIATDGRDNSDVPEDGNTVEKVVAVTKITEEFQNSNVVVVLDRSRSMQQTSSGTLNTILYEGSNQTRLAVAKQVINKYIIDKMDFEGGSEVSLIAFWGPNGNTTVDTNAYSYTYWNEIIGGAETSAQANTLKSRINSIQVDLTTEPLSQTGTCISTALRRAKDEIVRLAGENPDNKNVVIFISDGKPEGDDDKGNIPTYASQLKTAVTGGVEVYTIGFGANPDNDSEWKTYLQDTIASSTSKYFYAGSGNMNQVFNDLSSIISPATPVNVASNQGKITLTDVDTSKKVRITVNNNATPIERTATSSTYVIDLKEFGANASVQIQYYKKKN